MSTTSVKFPSWPWHHELSWRDPALVVTITLLSTFLCAHFELNEAVYASTRRTEYVQLDKWPVAMLVLSMGLICLTWKRHRHELRELEARWLAEVTLARVRFENGQSVHENFRIQELERKHRAREMHDELGQYLNSIKLDAVPIHDSRGSDSAASSDAARGIIRAVDHIHGAVTDMIGRLRPAGLDELALIAAIEHCVEHWHERLPTTQFQLSVSGEWEHHGEILNLAEFRLMQEGLMNVCEHAQAKRVGVALERVPTTPGGYDALRLTLIDGGCGIPSDHRTSRFGLSGMRERVAMRGGTFAPDSAPGHGLRMEASFPGPGGRP